MQLLENMKLQETIRITIQPQQSNENLKLDKIGDLSKRVKKLNITQMNMITNIQEKNSIKKELS